MSDSSDEEEERRRAAEAAAAAARAWEEMRRRAEAAAAEAARIAREAAEQARKMAMDAAESFRRPGVASKIEREDSPAISAATKDKERQDRMKAITLEEQVHENPPYLESLLEKHGIGDTVGRGQMSVSKWGQTYNVTREDLLDTNKHYEVMNKHLDYLEDLAKSRGMDNSSSAVIGTLWNNNNATEISDYGRRIERYENEIRSERLKRP